MSHESESKGKKHIGTGYEWNKRQLKVMGFSQGVPLLRRADHQWHWSVVRRNGDLEGAAMGRWSSLRWPSHSWGVWSEWWDLLETRGGVKGCVVPSSHGRMEGTGWRAHRDEGCVPYDHMVILCPYFDTSMIISTVTAQWPSTVFTQWTY